MILLHVAQPYDGGGVSNVVVNLAKAFSKLGYYNVIITPKCSDKYIKVFNECKAYPELMFLKPFNSYLYGILMSKKLSEKLRKIPYSPDAIIVHPGWYATLIRELVKKYASIVVVHGTYFNELHYMKYHPMTGYDKIKYMLGIALSHRNEIMVLKDISSSDGVAIVAVSKRTRKELECSGIRANNVHAILNGVDKNLFKPVDRAEAEEVLEKRYGVKIKGFILAHVGLGAIKGTHILIKALAMLKKRGVRFTALLAGRLGPLSYNRYLKELIERAKLSENVRFLGWVHEEDLPYVYSVADLTVVPSYSEGSPLVVPESLACGTPVIATDVGGNKEYLELVELRDLTIDLSKYDFSTELFLKIFRVMNLIDHMRLRISNSMEVIPSWDTVGMWYRRVFEKF